MLNVVQLLLVVGVEKKKAGDCEKNNIKGLGSIVTNKKQKRY